ncbi:tRNA1(Val) (adenine(37)-N6)-methyltransferase [Dyadobacter pollutisoli]|jgi:tRNA1Val (adenine37-N6)-methyltransferase|uniref:tRNA1(Val) (adenine(37)-N6)-methyltransferase n=1 Tax=Dyadobacter pollutisoli TaxID=2910158 RepID=A0A9E8N6G3_9BACT|nr:methyltransferase [Dyadobacter pollutisoli]WAC09643.1 methyltransferase [Dyadobacter pollutisoli]
MARNSHFKFKQFTVQQDQCAMKVCTDACVLGAWADVKDADHILDIGAGTGLLSLMVAQRNSYGIIDAVEIDAEAFYQAGENVEKSPFHDRIKLFHSAVQEFESDHRYDVIVTNPPFFQSDLLSPIDKKNIAHHAKSLDFEEILESIVRLLTPEGKFNILFPVDEGNRFREKAEKTGWFLSRKLTLFHHEGKKAFRQLMTFQREKVLQNLEVNEVMYIYETDGVTYHQAFKELLKDFYLIF